MTVTAKNGEVTVGMTKKLHTTIITAAQRYNFPIIPKKQEKKQPLLKRFEKGCFLGDEFLGCSICDNVSSVWHC